MSQSRHFVAPTYLVAFALALIPPIDSLLGVLPFRVGDPRWRFGAFGVVSNTLVFSLTGLLIGFLATTIFDHARFRRILGIVTAAAAFVLAAGWMLFLLDALQVRNDVKPAAAFAFKVATTTATLKALLAMVTLASLAVASFRTRRAASSSKASRRGGLLLGARKAPVPSTVGGEGVAPSGDAIHP
jgi:hypothetical protein